MPEYYKKTTCRLCQSKRLQSVLKLTPTAIGNHFVTKEQLNNKQKTYPLELDFCLDCSHVQLAHVVDPKILYQQNYSYVSSTSPIFVKHLQDYSQEITTKYPFNKEDLILEIGSNDGTSLSFFKKLGYRVLGIDPAKEVGEIANKNGIETICDFFSLNSAKQLMPKYGKAKLINSHNACAHIDDLSDVIAGVNHWLADDGLLVIEVGYLLDVLNNTWFDTIYHEHLDYHSLLPLISFFKQREMEVISAKRISPQGGSIRVTIQKSNGPFPVDNSVDELLELEKQSGLREAKIFQKFAAKISQAKQKLNNIITEIKQQKKSIAGFGAPTKATTLLTHFNLEDKLEFLIDDNKLKQGLYSPGHHIPVYSAEILSQHTPDYLLILAWNFAEDIMEKHQFYKDAGGKFILPMPEAKII